MDKHINKSRVLLFTACILGISGWTRAEAIPAPGSKSPPLAENKIIAEADCSVEKLGATIAVSAIGEPVSEVTLDAPVWTANSTMAYCSISGSMAPMDKAADAKPINFRIILPASWNHRAAQMGGGGNNGIIPNLLAGVDQVSRSSFVQLGFATYGSDSEHQSGPGMGPSREKGAVPPSSNRDDAQPSWNFGRDRIPDARPERQST